MLLSGERVYTYGQVDLRSNQVARALRESAALRQGDAVALFLTNRPDYVWLWLGCAKLGCALACLNCNIRARALVHCFQCSGAKVLLADPDDHLKTPGSSSLTSSVDFNVDYKPTKRNLNVLDLKSAIEEVLPTLKEENVAVYYLSRTSDTEGVDSFLDKMDAVSDEPIPQSWRSNVTLKSPALYIYTSGTTGLHGCILQGATLALRSKFSATQFWDDCRKYKVTVIQYIGEVLRYLCNVPTKDNDRDHRVRIAIGNGLRADVWREFIRRFGNMRIFEFYAATEGNVGFLNYTGKIGAVGRLNFFHKTTTPSHFGWQQHNTVILSLATLTGVFKATGPLRGVVYKENFREWKGENVATTEVADILGLLDFIQEVNVYGVSVPGHEGRTGMASIRLKEGCAFDGGRVYQHVADCLPSYARPRFVRIQDVIETTGTFKHRKVQLVEEGFNPAVIKDTLYFLEDKEKSYVPLTEDIYNSICSNSRKL
uniref:Uncharacterized protein n=1 Tax=Sphaerodactylus townsendi TaxID=933632 RepID=A0ACB8E634_9SAUR